MKKLNNKVKEAVNGWKGSIGDMHISSLDAAKKLVKSVTKALDETNISEPKTESSEMNERKLYKRLEDSGIIINSHIIVNEDAYDNIKVEFFGRNEKPTPPEDRIIKEGEDRPKPKERKKIIAKHIKDKTGAHCKECLNFEGMRCHKFIEYYNLEYCIGKCIFIYEHEHPKERKIIAVPEIEHKSCKGCMNVRDICTICKLADKSKWMTDNNLKDCMENKTIFMYEDDYKNKFK